MNYQVGEKEYSLEELQNLIEKGNTAIEAEKTYNTDFKSAWSAYGKTQNENKELREKQEELQAKLAEYEKNQTAGGEKSFNREEMDQYIDQKLNEKEIVKDNLNKIQKLQSEYDGENGKPKFDVQETLEYMKNNNLVDAEKAFNAIHQDDIVNWKAQQLARKPGFAQQTGESISDKQPITPKFTRDNLRGAISEALSESSGKI